MTFINVYDASGSGGGEVWEPLAAVFTAVGVVIALIVVLRDAYHRVTDRGRRKALVATSVLHGLQLSRNHLNALREVLRALDPAIKERAAQFGAALLNPHSAPLFRHVPEFDLFDESAACDFAYAVSLIESIDGFGRWLCGFDSPADEAQWERVKLHAEFFAEAAEQAVESLQCVEDEIRKFVPARVLERRFGPEE